MLRASNMNITTTSLVVVVLQYILASMCIVFIVLLVASIFPYYTSYELVIISLLITTRLE